MSFAVAAESYDRFMGRYSMPLAPRFLDFARIESGPVLDVGCGPGALTSALVERFGEDAVAAADPSESFVAAARERHPGVRVELAAAEELPFDDGEFAAALAQLVVHFMTDPVAGLREMARVTREGGVVAACVWDLAGRANPLGIVWQAAQAARPGPRGRGGARRRDARATSAELFEPPGCGTSRTVSCPSRCGTTSFDEWWEPFTLGVGPAGSYVAGLDEDCSSSVRDLCRELLPRRAVHDRACAPGRLAAIV